jgi:hypothetical protein
MRLALGFISAALRTVVVFVFLLRLDTEHAGVATRAVRVTFTKRTEEFGKNFMRFLLCVLVYCFSRGVTQEKKESYEHRKSPMPVSGWPQSSSCPE